jgi:hypothetical protein
MPALRHRRQWAEVRRELSSYASRSICPGTVAFVAVTVNATPPSRIASSSADWWLSAEMSQHCLGPSYPPPNDDGRWDPRQK